ncbi:MAG TPA: hypothetical protein VK912_00935 [Longimicrobiales bacterium]|nr:hypothetical protein [Longimicrobiales bacterium]
MSLSLITIRGSSELVGGLQTSPITGLDAHLEGARRAPGDLFEVGAYASDEAITELQARGLTVEVQMNSAALASHLDELESEATNPGGGVG